ncbi:hypothetical protein [Bacillus altitudinis]|uniref:hypothetical protein n=1 Tax=Bacillus altitudinis TaxID=293387 RepID=UPI0039A274CD
MTIKLSNLSDETKLINESGFLLQTVAETKEDILERGEHHHEDTWFLFLHEDVFGDEVEIDILPDWNEGSIITKIHGFSSCMKTFLETKWK